MKVAIIGQSAFGAEVYKHLLEIGHEVVGVFTIPDVKGKEDPLAAAAATNGHPVFKFLRWKALKKDGGAILPEVLEQYKKVEAELNVLAFVTQFIPMEISASCKHGSIIYHPSLLPRHRGTSAINWTLMEGDAKTGLTVFWADDGLDTGPILLQKECAVDANDTVNSIYKRFLFPEGVKALGEAVNLIAKGEAPKIAQSTENASYDPLWKDPELAQVNFQEPSITIHNFIRGNDRFPGAWAVIMDERTTLFGSSLVTKAEVPEGRNVEVKGRSSTSMAVAAREGLFLEGSDGGFLRVSLIKRGGQIVSAGDLYDTAGKGYYLQRAPGMDSISSSSAT